jgi:chromosome segregation ATPase
MAESNGTGRLDRIERALESLTTRGGSLTTDVQSLSATAASVLTGMESLNTSIASITEVTKLIAGQLNDLAEKQIETEERFAEAGERISALVAAQQHTDEKLNALIETVDDLIRGTSPPPAQPS